MYGFSQIQAVALLATASVALGQAWDHSLFTTSPPVYPSRMYRSHPLFTTFSAFQRYRFLQKYISILANIVFIANTTGLGGWEAALVRADAFTSQLTLEEKTRLVTGTTGPCVVSRDLLL